MAAASRGRTEGWGGEAAASPRSAARQPTGSDKRHGRRCSMDGGGHALLAGQGLPPWQGCGLSGHPQLDSGRTREAGRCDATSDEASLVFGLRHGDVGALRGPNHTGHVQRRPGQSVRSSAMADHNSGAWPCWSLFPGVRLM